MEPLISEESFKSTKTMDHLSHLTMGSSEIFALQTVSVSRVIVYNAVSVSKIATVHLEKKNCLHR